MSIRRYGSRTESLDTDFLAKALDGASKYFRLAGYFRSSIFELIGEEIAKIPEVKIVCNSELDAIDFQVASGRSMAIKERWNQVDIEAEALLQKEREIRLVVATDAACEGLNLQTLGTLINVDLRWNPPRLEQRLGRIKRFGQARKHVDMLNLVYAITQDERIYNVLSSRLKDTYDIFGSIPDTIKE